MKPWKLWAAAVLSAALLELPFPLAGPLPAWRAVLAWLGLAPLIWAVLHPTDQDLSAGTPVLHPADAGLSSRPSVRARALARAQNPHPIRRGFLLGYLAGVLWYMGNCYWIYATMHIYGGLTPLVSVLLLIAFSLVLGAYWGLFGLGLALVRQKTNSVRAALMLAPFLWTGLDLLAARLTSVPWDQLGYSQIDNRFVTWLAPWTGVYGITFLLVGVNAVIAGGWLLTCAETGRKASRRAWSVTGAVLLIAFGLGLAVEPPRPAATDSAVLVQPDLNVGDDGAWGSASWNRNMAQFAALAAAPETKDTTYIAGIPETGARTGEIAPSPADPDLVVWPESPAPFIQGDPRLAKSMRALATTVHAPLVIGGIGVDAIAAAPGWRDYNSAMIYNADGRLIGRYDKIHLVPFGEYIPFQNLLFFAHKLTGRVGAFARGTKRSVFTLNPPGARPHRYGVFICYEAVFADEVRHFAANGAEALVNISDDGWYGDTSAPWQHLNMARMRAIENRRWLLRDTNNGITAVIDPYGTVRESIPRHQVGELTARFAFNDAITFYSAHGDVFAWLCALAAAAMLFWINGLGRDSNQSRT